MTRTQAIRFGVVAAIWGLTWRVIADQIGGPVPPLWSVAYRFILAGAAMFAWVTLRGGALRLSSRGHLFALGVGLLQFALNFNLVYRAEAHVTSGLVSVVFALLVVPNAFLAWAVLGHRLAPRVGVGALMGIVGVALLFHDDLARPGALGAGAALGLGLTVLAVLAASTANVMQGTTLGRAQPPLALLAHAMVYGAALDAVLAFALSGPPVLPPSLRYIGGLAYLGLFASAIAFALYYELIRTIGPSRAAYTSLVSPFIAMGVSTAYEGYHWSGYAIAGAVLAAVGIAVALGGRRA